MSKWVDFTFPGSCMRRAMKLEVDGSLTVLSNQPNLRQVLEENRALRNRERRTTALRPGESMTLVARIPMYMLDKWYKEEGINFMRQTEEDRARITQKLNDFHEYGDLRTAPGRI